MGQAARGGSPTEMRPMLQVRLLTPRADLFLERGDVSAVPPTADRQLYAPRIFRNSLWCCNYARIARLLFTSKRFPKTRS